jgi:hypothetical protein
MALVALRFMVFLGSISALLPENSWAIISFSSADDTSLLRNSLTFILLTAGRKLYSSGIFCRHRVAYFAGLEPRDFPQASNFVE